MKILFIKSNVKGKIWPRVKAKVIREQQSPLAHSRDTVKWIPVQAIDIAHLDLLIFDVLYKSMHSSKFKILVCFIFVCLCMRTEHVVQSPNFGILFVCKVSIKKI